MLTAWLYTATRNAAVDHIRAEQRRATREQEATAMQNLDLASSAADWTRIRPVLDTAMDELGETDRVAVLMRFFERRRFADIGVALNLTEDSARMRVERALDKLRVQLARRGVSSASAALAATLTGEAAPAAPAGLASAISAGAVSGAAAAAGPLMTTTTWITSAVAFGAIGLATLQFAENRRTQANLATLAHERDGLRAQLRDVQQRTTAAEQQNAALQRDLAAAQAAKTAAEIAARPAPAPGPLSTAARSSSDGGVLTFRASPAPNDPAEARRITRQMNLEGLDATHRVFYRRAGFTPGQIDQFKTLMTDYHDRREARSRAEMSAALAQNPRPDRAAMQATFEAANRQAHDEWLATIRSHFGAGTLQVFQHHTDILPAGEVTKALSTALFYTDTPLTVVQAEQLQEIVAANSRNAAGKVELAAMNTDAILAQAQPLLSPPQLAALKSAQLEVKLKWTPVERTAAPSIPRSPGN